MQNLPKPGIYKITCIPTQKVYIGQSVNLKRRVSNHRASLRHGKHINEHLQSAVNKYGIENFKFEAIEYPEDTSIESLTSREQYWINFFNSMDREKGFNRKEAGNAGSPDEESREKMSQSQMGLKKGKYIIAEERRKKPKDVNRPFTKKHKEGISAASIEKYRNPEFRESFLKEYGKYPTIKAEVTNMITGDKMLCWSTREIASILDVHMSSILNWNKQFGDSFKKRDYLVSILEK